TDNPFWPSVASVMDQPQQIRNGDRPRFAPPLSARPRGLSVSDMALWRQDPYALYAKKILRLKPLDPPENEAAARDWGNVVHQLLEELSPQKPFPLERWHQRSHEIIDSLALPAAISMQWLQRLRNIGTWFSGQSTDDIIHTEITGYYKFEGQDFTVNGRADRVTHHGNQVTVSDYKTGTVPSWSQVKGGYAPQLPFLGLIVEQHGFAEIPAGGQLEKLQFLEIKGKAEEPVKIYDKTDDIDTILERNHVLYSKMIETFDNAATPYITRPHPKHVNRYNDYDHLERVQEWSSSEDGDGT
ncbi:MAG TPA: PD-(D/E)XK nuclease family protein, partial [Alphaproteobacteria bacterium]